MYGPHWGYKEGADSLGKDNVDGSFFVVAQSAAQRVPFIAHLCVGGHGGSDDDDGGGGGSGGGGSGSGGGGSGGSGGGSLVVVVWWR